MKAVSRELPGDGAKVEEHLQIIRKEIDKLGDSLEEFINAVRPSRANMERADINTVIVDAVRLLTPQLEDMKTRVVSNLDGQLSPARLDPGQMRRVLINLVLNAAQSMPSGGTIIITTAMEHHSVIIEIEDHGTGMDRETVARIFDPYFTTRKDGTGLGLSVVKRVMHEHHGRVEIESAPGAGTRIRLLLPALIPDRPRLMSVEAHDAG